MQNFAGYWKPSGRLTRFYWGLASSKLCKIFAKIPKEENCLIIPLLQTRMGRFSQQNFGIRPKKTPDYRWGVEAAFIRWDPKWERLSVWGGVKFWKFNTEWYAHRKNSRKVDWGDHDLSRWFQHERWLELMKNRPEKVKESL